MGGLRAAHRRILAAMAQVVYERGYAGASVGAVCARAGIARPTFYQHFDDLQACFLAALDDGTQRAQELMAAAFERERSWLDGIRRALAELLCFFDAQPELAYVLLLEATAAGPRARERRERHVASVTKLIEDHWGEPEDGQVHPFVNPGVMASLLGVLQTQLVHDRERPLIDLLGPLMGMATTPYLGRAEVQREIARAEALVRELHTDRARGTHNRSEDARSEVEIPSMLRNPRARRARACLLYLAANPTASNRQIADAVGIQRRTQASTLFARLARMGLVRKQSARRGGPNAWVLTEYGIAVTKALQLALDR